MPARSFCWPKGYCPGNLRILCRKKRFPEFVTANAPSDLAAAVAKRCQKHIISYISMI